MLIGFVVMKTFIDILIDGFHALKIVINRKHDHSPRNQGNMYQCFYLSNPTKLYIRDHGVSNNYYIASLILLHELGIGLLMRN